MVPNPYLLLAIGVACLVAGWGGYRHGCNQLADTGDMAAVTRKVNGGLAGLDDRLKLYSAALAYLGASHAN